MCGQAEAQQFTSIPLSDNTVKLRMYAIASMPECLKNNPPYALQMDVSCEGLDAHALTFVRYMSGDAIPAHDMAQGMFSVLRGYIDEKSIEWWAFAEMVLPLSRDGEQASALRGNTKQFYR